MKTLIGILGLITAITIMPSAFAANIGTGDDVIQTIKIQIGDKGKIHVIHDIEKFDGSAKLKFLEGTRSNFDVLCILCHQKMIYEFDNTDQIFEESEYMIFHQYPIAQDDLTVEYDLEDVLEFNNGLWKWDFRSEDNPKFYFEEHDLIFFDGTPIDLTLKPGFACGGSCNMILEFFDNNKSLSVTKYQSGISIQSDDIISNFEIMNNNTLSFDTNKERQLVVVDIPWDIINTELYNVYISPKGILPTEDDRLEKQFIQKVEAISIIIRSNIVGNVIITNLNGINTSQSSEGGGCLIATAAYGSEMAPQVQFLREIRDNTVLQTQSGTSFMTAFNTFYYTFSPTIADYERENPVFKEAVKIGLTPLLTSLTILNYVDIDTEQEMLGYGIGIIMLNIGMYFVAPAVVVIALKKRLVLSTSKPAHVDKVYNNLRNVDN